MKKMVLATVLLASLATLVAGLAAVNALGAPPSAHPLHSRGVGGGPWYNNTQVTAVETVIDGVIVDAEGHYLVVGTGSGEIRIAAPQRWTVNGQTKSWFKLFAEDSLNIGDRVRATVLTVTLTRPTGVTVTAQILKAVSDLSTGVDAAAILPPRFQRASSTA
ncbi:MAG: hypothetical protein QW614_00415 [Candidatus Caldarchaeum sp.]|uniref:Uncharacterized protein n=1 Tax=Caldiarchaeum subterraneum TaxID=311458 RepID=A0A7C5L9Q1_CALS0